MAARSPAALPTYELVRLSATISGVAVLGMLVFGQPLFAESIGYSLVDISFALLLTLIVLRPSNNLAKVLRWRAFAYTGQIAYGLYLLHGPASWLARNLIAALLGVEVPGHSAISVPITFLASFLAASLSWRFLESPILSLKDRLTEA
jgi:peptidoglycan/LPS O-acetylase OafA/YrhL